MEKLTFIIADGKVEIKATGFKGSACEAATKAFETVLGGDVTGRKHTSEYYEEEPEIHLRQSQ